MGRELAATLGKLSQNPFKGDASLVLRLLLTNPAKSWTGQELSQQLSLSQAWVNRVLGTLETQGIVARAIKGPDSTTRLVAPDDLLEKWFHHYQINLNPHHFYLSLDKSPLKKLARIAEHENWHYALTGYEAANLIKPTSSGTVPTVFLWPKPESKLSFIQCLTRLENQHRFIPVKKEANLIILEPIQKDTVFFGCRKIKGLNVVSPTQLILDFHSLDQGKFVTNALSDFWKKNQIPYDL